MNRILNKVVFYNCLFLSVFLISCINEYPKTILLEENNWELKWEEDFQKSILDSTVWSKAPRGKANWSKYMSQNASCYEIRDGTFILKGLVNDFDSDDTELFLTGGITTLNKKHFQYGKIEVRAKMDKIDGTWPAIWMLTVDRKYLGELDIMESYDKENVIHQTAHSYYSLKINSNVVNHGVKEIANKSEYNIYGVIIEKDYVIFYVNNSITLIIHKSNPEIEGQFPFESDKYLLLTMQFNHEKTQVNPLDLPAEMTIDWVRYYTKIDENIPDF